MGVTGLGTAAAVLASSMPELIAPRKAYAGDLGDRVALTSWPNYHDPKNFEKFTAATGVKVDLTVFGSNEEMYAKLKAGGTGWDAFVPTNYTISNYVAADLIEPLELGLIPMYDPSTYTDQRFTQPGMVNDKVYAVHKDWGTTGYCVNTAKVTETVRVTDRPFVGAVSMRATYPAYLGRAPEGLPVGEPARIPRGTVIEITGRASTALRDVRLVLNDQAVAFQVKDHAFAGRFTPQKSGKWMWAAAGLSGFQVTTLREQDKQIPVMVRLRMEERARLGDIQNLYVYSAQGDQKVPLVGLARLNYGIEPTKIRRWNYTRTIIPMASPTPGVTSSSRSRRRSRRSARTSPTG